jgi:hypothetical protein
VSFFDCPFFVYGFLKTFYQETDSVFEISSILALVASSAFSFTNALIL